MTRLFLLIAAVLVAAAPAEAAKRRSRYIYYRPSAPVVSTVPTRTVSSTRPVSAASTAGSTKFSGSMQAWAEAEAGMMAARRFKGHVRSAPNGTFVGVGFSTSGRVVTCVGSGRLVAQATVRGSDGFYHVRVWR